MFLKGKQAEQYSIERKRAFDGVAYHALAIDANFQFGETIGPDGARGKGWWVPYGEAWEIPAGYKKVDNPMTKAMARRGKG